MSEYLRMSGIYWCVTAMDVSRCLDRMNKSDIIQFVIDNQTDSGGFAASQGHHPHLLHTLSAVQVSTIALLFYCILQLGLLLTLFREAVSIVN